MALPLIPLLASMGTGQGLAWTTAAGVAGGMAVNSLTKDKEAEAKKQEKALKEQQQNDNEAFQNALNDEANQQEFLNAMQNNKSLQESYNNSLNATQNTPKEENEVEATTKTLAPKFYRNTGISYFDNKEHLSLADAFLAKELGLNLSYVNMDLNANVKKTDIGKAKNELAGLFADSKSLLDGVSHYEKTYIEQDGNTFLNSHAMAGLGRKINDVTNGFINFSNNANEKILSRNKMDAYTLASLMNGGAGKRTNQNINDAKAVIDNTWKGRENYYAGVVSGLENGINFMNEKMSYMQNAGIPVSQSDSLKMYLLNELKKDLNTAQGKQPLSDSFERNRKALGILNEKGDAGINEAMRLIQAK